MQKLLLETKKPLNQFKEKNLIFINEMLSLYSSDLNILSIILLWALETKILKNKSEDKFIIYFNNQYKKLDSIYTSDFNLYDSRNVNYRNLYSDESYFIIGVNKIFLLSYFENHRLDNLIKKFKANYPKD